MTYYIYAIIFLNNLNNRQHIGNVAGVVIEQPVTTEGRTKPMVSKYSIRRDMLLTLEESTDFRVVGMYTKEEGGPGERGNAISRRNED